MNIDKAKVLALSLMNRHGLIQAGWTFYFGKGGRAFGRCNIGKKKISLSRILTELNSEYKVRDTILHEIAHALVPPRSGHDDTWKDMCRTIGAKPERCYDSSVITPPPRPPKYLITCPHCGRQIKRHKYRVMACGQCCRRYNRGKFTRQFIFKWESLPKEG